MSLSNAIAAIAANDSSVSRFSNKGQPMSTSQLETLGKALRDNTYLTDLDLDKAGVTNAVGLLLGESLKTNRTLTVLSMKAHKMGAEGVTAVAEALTDRDASLLTLNLEDAAPCGTAAEQALATMFTKNINLVSVYIKAMDMQSRLRITEGEVRNRTISTCRAKGVDFLAHDPARIDEWKAILEERRQAEKAEKAKANAVIDGPVAPTGGPYTFKQLTCLKEWLPSDIDVKIKETYLTDAEFQEVFKMAKEEFAKLPAWKRNREKKTRNMH